MGWIGERRGGGDCWVLRGSKGPALLFKSLFVEGSPTASLTLLDGVNVLTRLASPGTLGRIQTLEEVQQQCQGRGGGGVVVNRTCEATYGQR